MEPIRKCHVLAMPYPGRGHVNPMMNICKQLCAKKPDIVVTFVVTEEWAELIGSDPARPTNITLATLPNVIPSEHGRAGDFTGFVQAVRTKLEAPFEELLDRLELEPSVIIADTFMKWVAGVANRENIPVASLWTTSASVFSVFHHFELLRLNGHFPANLAERGEEIVKYIPGVSPTRLADLTTFFFGDGLKVLPKAMESVSSLSKANYILFTSAYELEPEVFDALKTEFPFPLYSIGPSIPHGIDHKKADPSYIKWLDSQPSHSVLYISMGSFLSVSKAQLDEIVAGVNGSSVRYLWVARGDTEFIDASNGNGLGFVVPWCDQLRVLCHPSVGGFWTHCGWNSTMESVFAGVPMLTFPIFWDQIPNSKRVVEDWKIGYRVRKEAFGTGDERLATRDEITMLLRRLMDMDGGNEGVSMRRRAEKLREACRGAVSGGGSSDANLDSFLRDISRDRHT